MGEVERDIKELAEKTARTRYQFLRAELQTCSTALEMAQYELTIGNTTVAEREVDFVEKGVRTLQRFLPEVSDEQKKEIEKMVADLAARLDSVKTELGPRS